MRAALLADFPVHALPGFSHLPPAHSATWFVPLIHAWAEQQTHDLHWISCTKHVHEERCIEHLGQTFHLLPRGRLSLAMLGGFRSERRAIAAVIRQIQPDLLHAWGTEQGYARAALDHPLPHLLSMQGILQSYCKASAMPLLTRIQARAERRDLPRFSDITVESPWGRDQLRALAPNARIHLLEYGVNPSAFEITRQPDPGPLAVFVGTLNPLKGVDLLLRAFQDPRLAHVRLILIGDGPLRNSVSAPNIHFAGYRSHTEVLETLSRAWCLVHPTRADTSPNCVKEARVIGLPVVTTPNGGQTQYVTHRQSGWIHQTDDLDGLIEGILFCTSSRETSLALGAHHHPQTRTLLQPGRTAQALTTLYQSR